MKNFKNYPRLIPIFLILSPIWVLAAPLFQPLPRTASYPTENSYSVNKVKLGSELFHDARISLKGTHSCATCHDLGSSGSNNLPNALLPDGIHFSRHKVPTVWNATFQSSFFWSGGAKTLEEQAKGPLEEMGLGDPEEVVKRIAQIPGYVKEFSAIFGKEGVTLKTTTAAIATYERTLTTPSSRLDRFLRGDRHALNAEEKKGMKLFSEVGCIECHSGVNFAGPQLPQGTPFLQKFPVYPNPELESKYHFNEGREQWRVPSLRNVALTAPYFHNGSVPTLAEAILVMTKLQLGKDLNAEEVKSIEAFLRTLTGKKPRIILPELPPLTSLENSKFPRS